MDRQRALERDVEELRERVSNTADLYREVCALLFFRYGVTPTTNKLYQLVRKGSMSVPTQALARFWQELREKSRVRIERPDLPDEFRALGGELIGRLWEAAQRLSTESLESLRREAAHSVAQADERVRSAEEQRAAEARRAKEIEQLLQAEQEHAVVLRERIASLETVRATLVATLDDERKEKDALQARMELHRREFAQELQSLRESMRLAEERARSSEKRMLLEVDAARTTASRLQKDLDALHQKNLEDAQRYGNSLKELQERLAVSERLRTEALQSRTAEQERRQAAVDVIQQQNRELESLKANEAALRKELASLRDEAQAKPTRKRRERAHPRHASAKSVITEFLNRSAK